MATIIAQATGNWSAGATWTGGVKPGAGDVADCGNFVVTIDEDITCTQLTNNGSGHFELAASTSPTINANIEFHSNGSGDDCLQVGTTNDGTIINGNVTNDDSSTNTSSTILNSASLTINGYIYGGENASGDDSRGVYMTAATSQLTVVNSGNTAVKAGSQTRNYAIHVSNAQGGESSVHVTGDVVRDVNANSNYAIFHTGTNDGVTVVGAVKQMADGFETACVYMGGAGTGNVCNADQFYWSDGGLFPVYGRFDLNAGGTISMIVGGTRKTLSEASGGGSVEGLHPIESGIL